MTFSLFSEEYVNKLLQQYLEKGQWSRAAEQYKKLIKLHPENINLQLRIAEVYLKSGNKKDALEYYQKVADHYKGMDNFSKTVTILRTMLNIDASLTHIRTKLAEVYYLQGNKEDMWAQYLLAFKHLEEQGFTTQAVSILEEVTRLRLEDPPLLIQIAEMFLERKL